MARLFDMTDADQSGSVDRAEFDEMIDAYAQMTGVEPGSVQDVALRERAEAVWNRVSHADVDGDGRISRDEYLEYCHEIENTRRLVLETGEDIFALMDHDGDGRVSLGEYIVGAASLTDPGTAEELFLQLDRDGDGYLTAADLEGAVTAYLPGEDDEAGLLPTD